LLATIRQPSETTSALTLVVGAGCEADRFGASLAEAPEARLLVLSALGVHPDARTPRLRALWDLEEQARGAQRPVLTLRIAPIVGPRSPLWLRLRSRPRLPEPDHTLLNPVVESDVIETIDRALAGRADWEGWYEVAGPEAFTLGELAELAARSPRLPDDAGAWEPPHAELREHRLAETAPWADHFGLAPTPVRSQAVGWS
jgi:nucleoside-diphosphate-sugar epimerase